LADFIQAQNINMSEKWIRQVLHVLWCFGFESHVTHLNIIALSSTQGQFYHSRTFQKPRTSEVKIILESRSFFVRKKLILSKTGSNRPIFMWKSESAEHL